MRAKLIATKHVVGRFRLGWTWVELRIDSSHSDGSGEFIPDLPEPQITVIEVGVASGFPIALSTLLHEAFEVTASLLERRYKACGNLSGSAGGCIFVMTHAEFAEITDRVGHFVASALPRFRAAALKRMPRKGRR